MINYDLTKIKALAFDVDGVLSTNNVYLSDDGDGQPQRTANIKDGYAMQLAVKCGLKLAIITGGRSAAVKKRYENLGVQNVFAGISVKIACFQHWLETENLKPEEVLYMSILFLTLRLSCAARHELHTTLFHIHLQQRCKLAPVGKLNLLAKRNT